MSLLVTAFEPFGGRSKNASQEAVKSLSKRGTAIDTIVLPVDFDASANIVRDLARRFSTSPLKGVIMFGEDPTAKKIALELASSKSLTTFSNLDLARIVVALEEAGLPVKLSTDPGKYVCEAAYDVALKEFSHVPVLFIHLPASWSKTSRGREKLARAAEIIVGASGKKK